MNPLCDASWWTLDNIKKLAEVGALVAALAFFIYKTLAGYLVTELSLKVEVKRSHSDDPVVDHLSIAATTKKGKKGTLQLQDAQARISVGGAPVHILELIGIERLTYRNDGAKWPGWTRKQIVWTRSTSKPFINFAPGDEGQFSCTCKVPRNEPATVEVVILGKRLFSSAIGQWRASRVSLPIRP